MEEVMLNNNHFITDYYLEEVVRIYGIRVLRQVFY